MTRVLFICIHNSARSQMAEAYLRRLGGNDLMVESAGLEPGALNPYVIRALLEDGIDISRKKTHSVFDLYKAGKTYNFVVTVCSNEAAERCPIFPGHAQKRHWPFPDPSTFFGSDEEVMAQVREVRDAIKVKVRLFAEELRSTAAGFAAPLQ